MKRKQPYKAPAILREVRLQLEGEILAASTVDKTAPIISNGQELVEINADSADFDWNNNWTWGQ